MITNIFKKYLLFPLYIILITVILAEVVLHFYNPFAFRVKGNDIILPVNQRYEINMGPQSKYEKIIIHTKNSLGFRGPEKPKSLSDKLSIITVGGSTTECYYSSDSLVWTWLLSKKIGNECSNTWLNNAGLNGHSTFGHQILLERYIVPLQPKMILFLTGINDLGRSGLNDFDSNMDLKQNNTLKNWLIHHSELFTIFINIKRYLRAKGQLGLAHRFDEEPLRPDYVVVDSLQRKNVLSEHSRDFIPYYQKRIEALIATCKKNKIVPVFMTQPLLFGDGIDPATGIDLNKVKTPTMVNGGLYWQTLELYNETVRSVCKQQNIYVIDLAKQMPKNSLYYYDAMHFTTEGNQKVAEIIEKDLNPYLRAQFLNFCK